MLRTGNGDILREHLGSVSDLRSYLRDAGTNRSSFLKLLRLSSVVTSSISTPPFFRRLSDSLDKSGKAVTKLNLLRITRVVCEHHPDRQTLVERFGLAEIVERLAKQDEAVLVRELAKEVIPILLFGVTGTTSAEKDEAGLSSKLGVGLSQRVGGMRRATSETIVDFVRDKGAPSISEAQGTSASTAEPPSASRPSTSQRSKMDRERTTMARSQIAAPEGERGKIASAAPTSSQSDTGDRPKHKRKISRSQLR